MFSTRYLLSALVALAASSQVSAHGYVALVNIDGTTYAGPDPATNGPAGKSIVRQISDVGPVKGASNPDLACGLGAHTPAALVAPAKAGSTVQLQWMDGKGPWIHEMGPMLTYMAQCTGTTCDKFDPKNAKWFKINEIGQKADGTWYQADVKKGDSVTLTLPSDLASGEYLLRHEIIALHNAASVGGAEMYPSCIQLRVSGSGNTSPSNTVSFPGAYKDDSPSLVVPDIYNPGFKYAMPGPKLSNLVSTVNKVTAQLTGKDTGSAAAAANPGSDAGSGAGAANAGASPSDAATSSVVSSSASASNTKAASSSSVKPTSTSSTKTSVAATSTAASTSKTSPSSSSSSSATSAAAASSTKTCKSRRSRRSLKNENKERMFAQEPAHFAKDDSAALYKNAARMFAQDAARFAKDASASSTPGRRALSAHRQHRSRLAHNA